MKIIDTLVGMCFSNTQEHTESSIYLAVIEVDGREACAIEIDEDKQIISSRYDAIDLFGDYYIITKEDFLEYYDEISLDQRKLISKIIK